MIKIKNNFLHKDDFKNLKDPMLGPDFPWYYNNTKVDKEPVLQKLKVKEVIRIKANLVPRTSRIHRFEKHTDQDFNCKGAILYINSNNGCTIFEEGRRDGSSKHVTSKENRIVLFNANKNHQGTTCTNEKIRVLINFNYQ